MWTCLTCNTDNEDATDVCIYCNLEKSVSEQIQIKLAKQKKTANIVIPIFNVLNSLNVVYLIIYGILHFSKLSFPPLYFMCILLYAASLVGLWQYKKWGTYLFTGLIILIILLNTFLSLFVGVDMFATLFSFISIVIYLNYIRYFA